jgi:tetratricopeptide (TPR) repeat protein
MKGSSSLLLLLAFCVYLGISRAQTGSRESAGRAVYREVSQAARVNFQFHNSPTPNKYLIETMGGGVAIFDYDHDGWADIFFVNGAALKNAPADGEPEKSGPEFWNRLFRNNRDGTFTDVTLRAGVRGTGYSMGVATGDYNNDGYTDLLVTNYGNCILYRNNGDGTFADVTRQAGLKTDGWNMSAGFFDYDNDGYLDLFITRYLQWNFTVGSLVCGANISGGRAYCHPSEFKAISNYLFHNNRDGTFSDVSQSSGIAAHAGYGLGVAFGDYNNDGYPDIYVANDAFPQFLFKNHGDGTFSEVAATAGVAYTEDGNAFSGMGTDFADLDNDGWPDILTTALPYEYFALFRNNGDGSFNYDSVVTNLAEISRLFGGWGLHILDYDNDGANEVFIANSHVMDNIEITQPNLRYLEPPLLLKYLGGKFVDISQESGQVFSQAWAARGAAFGDLFNDGHTDIVVSDYKYPAHLLRSEGGNRNHWIELDLEGRKSNRDAIGAKVRLTSESGKVQYRTVTTAGSYASASDRRVLFGIGQEQAIARIDIRWPSGIQQAIDRPKPDQILKAIEPSDSLPREDRDGAKPPTAWRSPGLVSRRFSLTPVSLDDKPAAESRYQLGLSLLQQGKLAQAVEALQQAIRMNPSFVDAHYSLGQAYGRLGGEMLPAAVDQFVEALRLKPDHVDARVALSSILLQERDSYAAVAELQAAIRHAPRNAGLYLLLGNGQYASRHCPEAIAAFRKALELNPQSSAAHYGIGLALLKQQHSAEAAKEFEAALNMNPHDALANYQLAKIALKEGDLTEAGARLNEAIHLQPEMAEAYDELAKLYRRQDKIAEAESAYRASIRLKPNLFEALYGLAQLLEAQGKRQEARQYFDAVERLQQARGEPGRANALNAEGMKLMDEGQLDKALLRFQRSLEADRSFFIAAYNQGVVLAHQGKNREAMQAFRAAVRLRPDFVMAHFGLAVVLKAMDDPAAAEELRKAHLLSQYVAQPLGRNLPEMAPPPK